MIISNLTGTLTPCVRGGTQAAEYGTPPRKALRRSAAPSRQHAGGIGWGAQIAWDQHPFGKIAFAGQVALDDIEDVFANVRLELDRHIGVARLHRAENVGHAVDRDGELIMAGTQPGRMHRL